MKFLVILCVLGQVNFMSCSPITDNLLEPCHRSDPDLNGCMKKLLYQTGLRLAKGVSGHNIPKFDPAEVDVLTINRALGGFIDANVTLKNIRLSGLAKTVIIDFKFDPQTLYSEMLVTIPAVEGETKYDISAKLQKTTHRSRGYATASFTDIVILGKVYLKEIERNGVKYFGIKTADADASIGGGHITVTTKDLQYKELAEFATNFFNDNPKRVLDMAKPFYVTVAKNAVDYGLGMILHEMPAERILIE